MGMVVNREVTSVNNEYKYQEGETGLEMFVLNSTIEFDALEKPWTELAETSKALIFQTFEWNRIWWKHFGDQKKLNIIIFYDQEKLVGIVPLFIDSIKLAGVNGYASLRFIGSNVSQPAEDDLIGLISYSDYLSFIIMPGYEYIINRTLIHYFRQLNPSIYEIVLNVVPGDSSVCNIFVPVWQANGFDVRVVRVNESQSIELPNYWEDFLKVLSKNTRSHTRRALKKISDSESKVFEITEVEDLKDVSKVFDELVTMHQNRWNRMGYLGTFAERANYNFHKEVTEKFFERGWLQIKRVHSIHEQQKCVAIDLNFSYNNRLYGVHCAVDDLSDFYDKSPGNALLSYILKEAIENGIHAYDFLRGDERYKKVLANKSLPIFEIIIKNPSEKPSLLASTFLNYTAIKRKAKREKEFVKFMLNNRPFWKVFKGYGERVVQKISKL